MKSFFKPGTTYIQDSPYMAPELLQMFQCVAVASHPRTGDLRAFGFVWPKHPGPEKAVSTARGEGDWSTGWREWTEKDAGVSE